MRSRPACPHSRASSINAWLYGSAVPVAWAVDRWLGEPAARWHPVVMMGRWLGAFGAPWLGNGHRTAFVKGMAVWCAGALACTLLAMAATHGLDLLAAMHSAAVVDGMGVDWLLRNASFAPASPVPSAVLISTSVPAGTILSAWPQALAVLLLGLLLKPLLAWRMLHDEVAAVDLALARGLPQGRGQLGRLVSRDTAALDATEVRESALESLAENLNDSLVAPLFWFAIAGLPGAVLYRFANTADAMWGYRGDWEWAGKWAARVDDALSWIPARLTAVFIAASAGRWLLGLRREAARTPSPNSGWPMAALAIALGLRFRKPGVYVLNDAGGNVDTRDMAAGLRLCSRSAWLAMLLTWAAVATSGWQR